MFIIFESSILYIVGSAGRGPYAAGKESETFHIRQAGLPGLKRSGRGPGASSVDYSPPLPPSVIIESGHASRRLTPQGFYLWLIRHRPNIASPSLSHIKAPRGLTIPRSRSLTLTEDDMGFRLNQDQPSRMSTVCLVCV